MAPPHYLLGKLFYLILMIVGDFPPSKNKEIKKSNKEILDDIGLTKEQILAREIESIVSKYDKMRNLKQKMISILRENRAKLDFKQFISNPKYDIKENFLQKSIQATNIRGIKCVSVDGSSVIKSFMNVDFSFLKAIAVKYYFYKNNKAKIDYFPDIHGFNNYNIKGYFSNSDIIESKTSLDMTYMEIKLLNELIEEKSDIDLIIIDGSVVIMPINLIFSQDPLINHKYNNLLREYRKLYKNCRENRIILIGSIKDTRTSAFTHHLRDSIQYLKPNHHRLKDFIDINYRRVFKYFTDIDLFNRLLKENERSPIFVCKKEVDKIRDTGIKKEIPYYFPLTFYAFYLKTAKKDVPIRVEFFMDEDHKIENASKQADLISKLLLPISNLNEYFGLPVPQIEAHKRASFKPQEINLLFNSLKRKLNSHGIELIEKRRNRRPF